MKKSQQLDLIKIAKTTLLKQNSASQLFQESESKNA